MKLGGFLAFDIEIRELQLGNLVGILGVLVFFVVLVVEVV